MRSLLITIGIVLLVAGLLWPWLGKLPLGRLPGDIVLEKGGSRFYLPLTSCLLVSLLATVLLWFFRR